MDYTNAHSKPICTLIYHCRWFSPIEDPTRNSCHPDVLISVWASEGCGFIQKMTSASLWPLSLSKYWDRTKLPLMLSCPQCLFPLSWSPTLISLCWGVHLIAGPFLYWLDRSLIPAKVITKIWSILQIRKSIDLSPTMLFLVGKSVHISAPQFPPP